MAKTTHPHYEAAKMAAIDMKDLMEFIKNSEYGAYPDSGLSPRTQKRHDAIADAPNDVRALLDNGFPRSFVERLARLAREDE